MNLDEYPKHWFTGRSTRIAFLTFAECYTKPTELIEVIDHYPAREANRHLWERMRLMNKLLEFNFEFVRRDGKCFVRLPIPLGGKREPF